MTIRKKLEERLYENGLFEDQAAAVVKRFEESEAGKPMKGRMDEDESSYPSNLMVVLWVSVKHSAVEWIDENIPQHWARAVFAN